MSRPRYRVTVRSVTWPQRDADWYIAERERRRTAFLEARRARGQTGPLAGAGFEAFVAATRPPEPTEDADLEARVELLPPIGIDVDIVARHLLARTHRADDDPLLGWTLQRTALEDGVLPLPPTPIVRLDHDGRRWQGWLVHACFRPGSGHPVGVAWDARSGIVRMTDPLVLVTDRPLGKALRALYGIFTPAGRPSDRDARVADYVGAVRALRASGAKVTIPRVLEYLGMHDTDERQVGRDVAPLGWREWLASVT